MEKISEKRFVELLNANDHVVLFRADDYRDIGKTDILTKAENVLNKTYYIPVENHRRVLAKRTTYMLLSDRTQLILNNQEPRNYYYVENKFGARFVICFIGPCISTYGDGYFTKIIVYALVWGGSRDREWRIVEVPNGTRDKKIELVTALRVNGITYEISGDTDVWRFFVFVDEDEEQAINNIVEKENKS